MCRLRPVFAQEGYDAAAFACFARRGWRGLPSRSWRSGMNFPVRRRPSGYGGTAFARFATDRFAGLAKPKLAKRAKAGGARRDRTADLVIANDALSQLSYGPSAGGPDTSQGQPAVGAIYNPRQGQVKNAEIAVFRAVWLGLPLFGRGGTDIYRVVESATETRE